MGLERRFFSDVLKDKVVLIYLFFTNCESTCPVINQKLANVQNSAGDRLGTDITLISITTDPANDTPPVVKEYSEKFGRPVPAGSFSLASRATSMPIVRRLGHTSRIRKRTSHFSWSAMSRRQSGRSSDQRPRRRKSPRCSASWSRKG